MFDIREYLDKKGIPYDVTGENISQGWIGINCIFCDDQLNHLGINLASGGFNCFRCPAKGKTVIPIIREIEKCSWQKARDIVASFTHWGPLLQPLDDRIPGGKVTWPPTMQDDIPSIYSSWFRGRNFDSDHIKQKYKIRFGGLTNPKWKFRIIIPIYMSGQVVSYIGRDITNQARIPYRNATIEDSIIPVHHCLYNIDNMDKTAIVVEGVTDAWRLGDGAVGTFGLKYTKTQILHLTKARRIFVMFDAGEEAQQVAEILAYDLSSLVPEVIIYQLSEGDPADLSANDVKSIRREIFGKL